MIPALYKAAQSLYAADTGAGSLVTMLTGGYYTAIGPVTTTPPYMIGSVQASVEEDAFGSDGSLGYFAFNIYTVSTSTNNGRVSVGPVADLVIARLRTVFHKKQTTVSFAGLNWVVSYQASSGLFVPESQFAHHHIEIYRTTCMPVTT